MYIRACPPSVTLLRVEYNYLGEQTIPRAGLPPAGNAAVWAARYVLSFVYIGIYWNNHHHLLHTVHRVSGAILWANLHLLFWLSLLPFATGWMGENHFAALPTAIYGLVLLMAALAYLLLQRLIIAAEGEDSVLAQAVGRDWKGKASWLLYVVAVGTASRWTWLSQSLYVLVALLWLIPDRRIERLLQLQAQETP